MEQRVLHAFYTAHRRRKLFPFSICSENAIRSIRTKLVWIRASKFPTDATKNSAPIDQKPGCPYPNRNSVCFNRMDFSGRLLSRNTFDPYSTVTGSVTCVRPRGTTILKEYLLIPTCQVVRQRKSTFDTARPLVTDHAPKS